MPLFNPITHAIEHPSITIKPAVDQIIVLQNPDKHFHEKWTPGRHVANLPHPFRIWMAGKPNSGKGLIAKNIINHANPSFERIVVLHCSKNGTTEWDDTVMDPEEDVIEGVPPLDYFDNTQKNLLIIDDFNLSNLDGASKLRIDRLLGFVSTHGNLSVIILHQDLLQSKVCQRRMCNIICLWKLPDIDSCAVLARKVGLKRKYFMEILKKFKSPHDFLMIDLSNGSPMPLRVNLYHEVVLPDED